MGQAKSRGSYEDRVNQAVQRRRDQARLRAERLEQRTKPRLAQLMVAMHQAHGKQLGMEEALAKVDAAQQPDVIDVDLRAAHLRDLSAHIGPKMQEVMDRYFVGAEPEAADKSGGVVAGVDGAPPRVEG